MPVGRYDAKLMAQICFDWPSLEMVLGRTLTKEERLDIDHVTKSYALNRTVTVQALTKPELHTQIDSLKQAVRSLVSFSADDESGRNETLRTLMGNRPVKFDWDNFCLLLQDFSERLHDASKSVKQGTYSQSYTARDNDDFLSFTISMVDNFCRLGGTIQAHRNANRPISPFVRWCGKIQETLPAVLRQHATSEITLSSQLSRAIMQLRRELPAWADSRLKPS